MDFSQLLSAAGSSRIASGWQSSRISTKPRLSSWKELASRAHQAS